MPYHELSLRMLQLRLGLLELLGRVRRARGALGGGGGLRERAHGRLVLSHGRVQVVHDAPVVRVALVRRHQRQVQRLRRQEEALAREAHRLERERALQPQLGRRPLQLFASFCCLLLLLLLLLLARASRRIEPRN